MKRCLTPAAKLCSQLADWSTGKVTIATPIVLSTRIFSCWRALPLKSCNCVAINKFSAPSSWTVSCGGFDHLPGVVILELRWAQVPSAEWSLRVL